MINRTDQRTGAMRLLPVSHLVAHARLEGERPSVYTFVSTCQRLDALPLALELAGRWVKALTPEGLLERLQRNQFLPADGPRDLPTTSRLILNTRRVAFLD